ncbi:hypothetical protein POM88_045991 [Heracleum sosnowskyi]|uniref:Replication factor A C-terminal domain-containing protein n=1 Tax=Heracleum sosnowskyi TaxID=360622 RepID=A0AAD8M6P8_9APIA|nr:hypothetical protein POM88_045991 [Heracleum sosnowskyi]
MKYDYHDVANLRKMLRQPMFAKYNFTTQAEEKIETLSIAEIRNLGINYIEKEVICQIKVNTVLETIYWNFYQCSSCYKEIEPVQGLFKCYRCADRNVPHPYKNWKLSVEAEDNSGRIEIVLMDREARTILGIYAPTNNEENMPSIVKLLENRYYTVKLEIKRSNIEQKSFTYVATGIFENPAQTNKTGISETQTLNESATETSGSGYHLDDFSQLNFQSPDVKLKNKKKRSLGKKKK